LEDGVDEDAGGVDLIGVELAEFDEVFDFGDNVVGGGGHHGIEVAGGFAEDEVAPPVAFPGFDESEVAADGAFEDELAAVEFAGFFAFGDHGAVTGGSVEGGDARATSAEAFGEGTLRIQFELQLAADDELLKEFVFTDVGGDHFLDLAVLKQEADAETVDASVVADYGQVFGAFAADGVDEIFRDAAEAETAHEDGGAVGEVGDGGVG